MNFCATNKQIADIFTKGLGGEAENNLREIDLNWVNAWFGKGFFSQTC